MFWSSFLTRRKLAVELIVCTVLVLGYSMYALGRMDYLSSATAEHVRMTDSTRTAYVAKNIAEGRGYTTNELPAFLVDLYDQRGKLHADSWPNADRFPFTAYATACLYIVTGSTSYEIGILVYNLIWFVGLIVLLYWFTRVVWNDRWCSLAAVAIALLHPLTYVYLYLKDADMMVLTLGVMAVFYAHFRDPSGRLPWKRGFAMGTLLAWLYLARPNIGGAFVAYVALLAFARLWRMRREHGLRTATVDVARNEGLVALVFVAWCVPFIVHSMSEWGSPMFSANSIYQLPLGTRYAMDTDTWWKYSEPGVSVTIGTLYHHALGELIAKFTTSWVVTIKVIVHSFVLELVLAFAVLAWLRSRASKSNSDSEEASRELAFRRLARMVGFAVMLNFLVLPLYGYQNYGYRHYLSFFLPLLWVACGKAIVLLVTKIKPVFLTWLARARAHPGVVLAIVVSIVVIWNASFKSQDANQLVSATSNQVTKHWLSVSILVALVLVYGPLTRLRLRPFTLVLIGACCFIVFRYQPRLETKRLNLNWFPLDDKVWEVLRQRNGLVMSFAMQSEVNWASDRRNIPAPEFPMHVYSLLFDHELEVEDVYIESAESLVGPWDGAFYYAAAGFEGYVRLEKYQGKLPGYEIVFHTAGMKGYPKYDVKPRPKASTIYRLVDRDAVRAMAKSPDRIELGKVDNVIYTAHGWGDYLMLDGKPAVAATESTRRRYVGDVPERPWEDTSTTFFLDDRRPDSVDLDIYATHTVKLQFYWNLDLYAYDLPADREKHAVGTYEVTHPGWQRVHLEVPPNVTRHGLNKLGFRSSSFQAVMLCPESGCSKQPPPLDTLGPTVSVDDAFVELRDARATSTTTFYSSVFAGTLDLHYSR